ncbi:protein PALE CRESS, chloroplastic-like [Eucalyptus grandis]|uniref:protein PALE CRESS, chloroplastic-like n=1 Tax=Eucalyptus grandis TaxID=71139 RepID=UPI00192E9074|nr:protein PALE CRESS, chloroplastic-like [Eucalyptus grandis]
MEANAVLLTCVPRLPSLPSASSFPISRFSRKPTSSSSSSVVLRKCLTSKDETLIDGLPREYYDDEWQARQREKTKELHRRRQEEDEEEERKVEEYREIGMRLKGYPEEDVRKARILVSSFIRSEEEVEEKIEEAAERGELTELILMVIWNRLDLARRDDEKDAVRSLDLLYRRVETEILKREAPPAMRLLNELLNLHDGFDNEGWLKECRKLMVDTFPGRIPLAFWFRLDLTSIRFVMDYFVREVDELLQEVRAEQSEWQDAQGLDPESVASRLKQQEKQQTIHQVEALLDLAINLKW